MKRWAPVVGALFVLPSDGLAQSDVAADADEFVLELESISVTGENESQTLRESSEAVEVVDTERDRTLTADTGEVLARAQGVGVRRSGGLGSSTRFSLNGLTDDQIRFFVDGIPTELSGFTLGISNVPVNLIERVEIHQGVVPVRFGADALGGAVNVVTDSNVDDANGSVSHQMGDFGTRRSTLSLNHRHAESGFFSRFMAFSDAADNDYEIDVSIPDETGRPQAATVDRFHDTYSADGARLALGLEDRDWAERIQLSVFSTEYDKDIQHNVNMSLPYGEARFDRKTSGFNVQYDQPLNDRLSLSARAGVADITTRFVDVADYAYNWLGEQVITPAPNPGELGDPTRSTTWIDNRFARLLLEWDLNTAQTLGLAVGPTWHERHARNHLLSAEDFDPLRAKQSLFTLVTGLEHTIDLVDDRLQNTLFVKHYHQDVAVDEPSALTQTFRYKQRDVDEFGWGNALRYRFSDQLIGKVSYEYATRLPQPDEIFGDGVNINDNLELTPEVSHNVNLGLAVDSRIHASGEWRGNANLFLRDTDDLILLIGSDRFFVHQNIYSARSQGIQAGVGWSSPGGRVDLDANLTAIDFRNTASDGTFARYDGDRIPNRPYEFANVMLRLNWLDVLADVDELNATWHYRFVNEYDLIWESAGLEAFRQSVPEQHSHSLALTYSRDLRSSTLDLSAEVQNLTDDRLYDFYGVQRPGRAFFLKATLDF